MKSSYWLVSILFVLLAIIACQKELDDSRDPNAKGVLMKDSIGSCSLVVSAGNFIAGKNLNDSNRLSVIADITTIGNYTIYTDTINGYSFKATGSFTTLGQQSVQLKGVGKPISVSIDRFNVYFTNSSCQTTIPVKPAVPAATYTLSGAPNGCTNATLSGAFIKGAALDSSSYVSITLSVTKAGSYSIATNTINGYSFSGSGILNNTGMQSVRLYTVGIPSNAGTDTFAVTANNSTCHFTVPITLPVDYLPLTANSYWVYDNLFIAGDSIVRTITGTSVAGGNLYSIMQERSSYSTRQFLYRKVGPDYFDYTSVTKYTTSITYRNTIMDGINFLKANVATGTSWQSSEYTDTASFGQIISIRYNYVCEEANTTLTLNGQSFSNVRKILMYPEIKAQGNSWGLTSEYYSSWYAKDIGLIYEKKMNNNFTVSEMAIRRWQVY